MNNTLNHSHKTKLFNYFRKIFQLPFLEKQIRFFANKKSPSSFFGKLVPNNYQYPPNTLRVYKMNGISLKVDISDYLGHYIYFGLENKELDLLFSMCKHDDVIIDVGANIGYTLIHFAKAAGKNGIVYGFEPDTLNYSKCLENVQLNKFTNIKLFNIGLGNEKAEHKLFLDTPSNRGGNRIMPDELARAKDYCIIQVEKLDDWIARNNPTKINLIKIDVEGYELNVLRGAVNTISKYHPLLFIEVDDNNLKLQGHSAPMLILFLENKGYKITKAEDGRKVSSSENFANCHFDIICRSYL